MGPFIWIELQLPSRPLDLQTTGHTPKCLLGRTVYQKPIPATHQDGKCYLEKMDVGKESRENRKN